MGSGCTKTETGVVQQPRTTDAVDGDQANGTHSADSKKAESASIKSTSTTSSRPPTPFARPITAPVMARPKTTTISERAELGLEGEEVEEADEMLDENLETLHPHKMRRTHSRNGDLLGDQAGHRKLSRHIAEDDEEMIKMKEYMEQKGL